MKKYFIGLHNSKERNEIIVMEENKAFINGKLYFYEHKFINNNILILRINNKNYFLKITEDDFNDYYNVELNSENYKVVCKSQLELMIDKMSTNKSDSKIKKEIHSPMPGIIKKLNVYEGEKVSKGAVLLVLEAMKMENEIKAVRDCVIKKVNVEGMKSVEKNELLIVLE